MVTTEQGAAATFTVVLTSLPLTPVTIDLYSSNTNEGTISPSSVSFNLLDWNTPQTITVTGADDGVAHGATAYQIDTDPAISLDPFYSGLSAGSVSVTNTDLNPVTISGTIANIQITDQQTATLFSGVTLADADTGSFTATVTLSAAANGSFSNLAGGSYNAATGVYTSAATTLSAAQAALRGLVFTPTDHQVAPNETVNTTFTIAVSDGFASSSDSSTTATATAVDTPVTIGGTTSTNISDQQTATPFSAVTVTDPDTGVTFSPTVTLSAVANGTLSNLAGGSYNSTTGVYSLSNVTLAAAQAALRGLVFTPTDHQVAPTETVNTTFTIAVSDGFSTSSNNSTTVTATATDAPATIGSTTASTQITDQQTAMPFSAVTLTDPDTGQPIRPR